MFSLNSKIKNKLIVFRVFSKNEVFKCGIQDVSRLLYMNVLDYFSPVILQVFGRDFSQYIFVPLKIKNINISRKSRIDWANDSTSY